MVAELRNIFMYKKYKQFHTELDIDLHKQEAEVFENNSKNLIGFKNPLTNLIGCCEAGGDTVMSSGSDCHYVGVHHTSLTLPIGPLPKHALVACDMGGSLIKVVYIPESHMNESNIEIEVKLVTYSVDKIDSLIAFLHSQVLGSRNSHKVQIYATGVGSLKFKNKIQDSLNADLISDTQEMERAVDGLNFLWQKLKPEQLLYPESQTKNLAFKTELENAGLSNAMLVGVGSALIIVQIKDQRIIGSTVTAGHTFLGLGALLTGTSNFEELHRLAECGSRENLDLFVKDTAGSAYSIAPEDAMVSSFGKAARLHSEDPAVKFSKEDLAASLLHNIVDQISTTAYLSAKAHCMDCAVFCGSFLSDSQMIREQIRAKFHECSQFLRYEVQPIFVRYEQYMGALGTLIKHLKSLEGKQSQHKSHLDKESLTSDTT